MPADILFTTYKDSLWSGRPATSLVQQMDIFRSPAGNLSADRARGTEVTQEARFKMKAEMERARRSS